MWYAAIILVIVFAGCGATNLEDAVTASLKDYDYMFPPTFRPVNVSLGLALKRIVEFTTHTLTVDVFMITIWKDNRFNLKDTTGSTSIPKSKVWIPDITLYERPTTSLTFEPNVVLHHDNRIVYTPAARLFTDNCVPTRRGLTECSFRLGSWTYDTETLNLLSSSDILFYDYQPNPTFAIVSASAVRRDYRDPCCTELWPYIEYKISIKQRSGQDRLDFFNTFV